MEENYYEILGVKPGASLGEIKKAFRALVKLHHPDKCGGANVADSTARYLQVKQAFETLSDSRARQDYDNCLRSGGRDRIEGNYAGDESKLLERPRAPDAAVRSLFAKTFFSGDDTEEDLEEREQRSHKRETTENTELFQRLNVNNEPLSHSDGFQQWLRTRPCTSFTVVNDETILRAQGAAVITSEDVTRHHYTWPVTALVRRAREARARREAHSGDILPKESGLRKRGASGSRRASPQANRVTHVSWSDELDEAEGNSIDESVELVKVTLKSELEWGDVLVRILHAPVLPYDCVLLRYHCSSLTETTRAPSFITPVYNSEPGQKADFFLGTSCVAEVIEVGRGVKELKKGDIVLPLAASDGCWRAAAVWQERRLMALPRDLFPKLEQAAVSKQLFLAYHLLQEYAQDLRPGDGVLIYSSGGLVSQLLLQFCRLLGFRSFFVRRKQCQKDAAVLSIKDYLKSLGATEVFDEEEDVAAQLTKARQSLPLLAIELNYGQQICTTIQWLAKGGKVVLVYEAEACAFPTELRAPSLPILFRGTKVESFYLNGWLESRKNQQRMLKALECIGALLRAQKLIVNLTEVHELSELTVKEALLSVRQAWRGASPHQQPLLTFASLEAEKLAFEEAQKINVLREQEARQVQETLFSQRDRVPSAARSFRGEDDKMFCPEEPGRKAEPYLELQATEKQDGVQSPVCFFVHDRGETVEELHIMFKRYKHNLGETFQNATILFPAAPFECRDDSADVPSWGGQHVKTLFAPIDGKKHYELRMSSALKGSTKICPSEVEALKDLEASCEYLADVIEEKVGVSGEKVPSVVLCGVGEGGLTALLTALTKVQFFVEAVVCIGMPLLDAHILSFLLSKTNKEAQKTKLFFLCGSRDSCCPAWCQEALRKFFSDAGYCATKEVILEGGPETDERTLAHLAAVFSILRLD